MDCTKTVINYAYTMRQENLFQEGAIRRKLLNDWEILKHIEVPHAKIAEQGISRAIFYRRKPLLTLTGIARLERQSRHPQRVRQSQIPQTTGVFLRDLRQQNPTYGKSKLTSLFRRDLGVEFSERSVGRIQYFLIKQGVIEQYVAVKRKRRPRRLRGSNPESMKKHSTHPGERVPN